MANPNKENKNNNSNTPTPNKGGAKRKEALGMGIRALLDNFNAHNTDEQQAPFTEKQVLNTIININISAIEVNPFQPRTNFDEAALAELAQSLLTHGVVQPITVRAMENGKYQLISGERRFRAAQLAGLSQLPAYIRAANDQELLEIALIENIQRQDLNPLEIARSYQRLLDECNLVQEELAARVSKPRPTVAHYLNLLKLPPEIQRGIADSKISMGHAKALSGVSQVELVLDMYHRIIKQGLSVRQVEAWKQSLAGANSGNENQVKTSGKKPNLSVHFQKLQTDLSKRWETKVEFKCEKSGKGQMVIHFTDDNDFNRILDAINS
ncbi:MAG: ParB/RepB/Spo0J family partition protein [Chitinophagales bacterium]|nr:ParB/RepB/Spo0J family partition protein [Chitinophagales bacterium]MCC7056746.1 ParB/RepB/Spo0J family partition protein [Chitinophagales bacterium]MDA0199185.1 ParB/RepB/Spo0J family partition protein [Bacteroidota bacterium]